MSFNPRAPCGARQFLVWVIGKLSKFQSTRPMRGATYTGKLKERKEVFQSTRPMRGATRRLDDRIQDAVFQSTRPMRGATRS